MATTALIPLLAACGGGSSGGGGGAGAGGTSSGAAGGGVAASCVAPTLTVTPSKVHPGDQVQVSGEWFADGCNDTAVDGQEPSAPPPITGMTLEVLQGGQSWPVTSNVDAGGEHYSFEVAVTIPDDVHAGKATMQAKGYGLPTDFEVVSGQNS